MSTAVTTSALSPPNPTSAVVSPSSTMPRPPGVIGIDPSSRTSDHAAKASITLTSPWTPKTRRHTSRTMKTVRCPARVAAVR